MCVKLFLNGGGAGIQTEAAVRKFNLVLDHSKPILYIPLAMDEFKYEKCYEWITQELNNVDVPYIEMIRNFDELAIKNYCNYSALFIGGGNTFKLLSGLKESGCFSKIREYIDSGGVIFGGSAGAIIFGRDLESCVLDDDNVVNLNDIGGFDVLDGISILCHYTNRTVEKDKESTEYLFELSKRKKIIALPEEDTIYINGNDIEFIGTKPYYVFENGVRRKIDIEKKNWR